MTNYSRGVRREYEVRDTLEKLGYMVIRSAGSHGAIDIAAIHYDSGEVLLVQVKSGASLTSREKKKILSTKFPRGCRVEVWNFLGRGKLEKYSVIGGQGFKRIVDK